MVKSRRIAAARIQPTAPAIEARSLAVPRIGVRELFIAAISLSAFLLFSLELLAGRLMLPIFGGAPAVWTTALCFFTAMLLVSYLYAHFSATRLGPRRGGLVHLVVAAVAIVATVAAPRDVAGLRDPGLPEALNVVLGLTVLVGAPAFVLGATTPLLSSWYAARGSDAWWLYAASNLASFIALLAYPFIVEPLMPLSAQRVALTLGLLVLGAALTGVVYVGRRAAVEAAEVGTGHAAVGTELAGTRRTAAAEAGRAGTGKKTVIEATEEQQPAAPRLRRQVIWLAAAFVPAGLLSATTNHLATDLVSAPLLWVGPLAMYLASFVVAFSERGRRILPAIDALVPAAATLLWLPWIAPLDFPVLPVLILELASFFVLALAIHGRLALDRPDPGYLTRFYLILSAGGALATAFVALAAPLVFSSVYEYPLLIVAGLAVLAVLPAKARPSRDLASLVLGFLRDLAPYAVAVLALLVLGASDDRGIAALIGIVAAGGLVIAIARSPVLLAPVTAAVVVVLVLLTGTHPILRERTFFSVLEVQADGPAHLEYSGTTLHGAQLLDSRGTATTYYVQPGPLGDIFTDLRLRPGPPAIGVVGLGAGTIARYAQPDNSLTFFEIDPAVVSIANDPRYFTFLAEAPVKSQIVLGDARLSLGDVPPASFDVLILDAFSSDAVPVHLLTREALTTYVRAMRPGGVVVYHVSNRYYDLAPAIVATARSLGLEGVALSYEPGPANKKNLAATGSTWVVVGRPDDVDRFRPRGWDTRNGGTVLTDDYADLLRLLRLGG